MDQKSTNGAGADKRNWRERLGIGAKDLPKLSDEFKSEPAPEQAEPPPPAGTAKPAPRTPQPVTHPAPMAPRTSAQKPAQPPAKSEAPPPQDALAEKLRAQRAAAERLAEQRVQAARERAESRSQAAAPALSMPRRTPQTPTPPSPASARPAVPPPRPKFSFAEEELPQGRREPRTPPPAPPLTPPRPALGGERAQPPFLRPSPGLAGARSQPTYRPIDPETGYAPPPRYQPSPAGRAHGDEPPAYGTRPPMRRPPAVDPYSRGYAGEEHEDPRLSRPPVGRGRGRQAEDELDDVFEDEPAPRPRASARDYQAAYRDSEGGFEEERRRSSGPWILLLALLVAALVTGGVVWFYNTQMKKTVATPGAADQVPVVSAPEQPAKTSPQPATDSQGSVAPALKKKQIYDRIVGDQEVSGDQVVPTEEVPVPPTTADQVAPSQSQGGEPVPVPTPDAPAGAGDEPLPLPPPPGSDTQGSLDQEGIEKIAAAAAAAPAEESSTAPPTAADGEISPATAMPPPEKSSDGAVVASAASAEAAPDAPAEDIAAAPAETRAEANVEDPSAAAPVKKKPAATKQTSTAANKKVAPAAKEEDPGAPLVLVAPSQQPIVSPSQNQPVAGEAAVQESTAQPPKKKRTLLDLFKGGSADAGNATAVDETQVASLPARTGETAPAPAPEQNAASGGSGYVVQLASFRSEAEATAEYGRLKGRYPNVVGGLPPRISEASVAGSTRYLLRLGPLASRDQATEVCNSLFAGGERDCLVRTQ